jgi:ATP-dependent exoDNAse (exonuclease V) beta subunit
MACVLPPERSGSVCFQTVSEDSDLQEAYDTERHLLYVACTRARGHLLVTAVEPASEFQSDLLA